MRNQKAEQSMYVRLYRALYRIRRVEEEIARIYPTDKIKSPVHLSIGQESVSVGVCDALQPEDIAFGTYRGHALYLAKGGDLKRMVAELYGKKDGCARGKAGSMHLVDVEAGMMGTSAIVATTIPQAVGYALALKMRREPKVVVCFFGDGATEEGVYHESLNFAALKGLPVLFVCEHNLYAIHSHVKDRMGGESLCRRAEGYGVTATRIEKGDIFEIRAEAKRAIQVMREGKAGPHLLECMTYRWKEHVGPAEDWALGYRSEDEVAPWLEGDQVARLARLVDDVTRRDLETAVDAEIAAAFDYAEKSEFPGDEELYEHVFHP
jgi:TPP-dependent pyruvate/acetoin dehydrogenase alpha subunit